jgi:hypothetical protein
MLDITRRQFITLLGGAAVADGGGQKFIMKDSAEPSLWDSLAPCSPRFRRCRHW